MKYMMVAELLFQSFSTHAEREALSGVTYRQFSSYIQNFRETLRSRSQPGQCIALSNKKTVSTYAMWMACWLEDRSVVFLSPSMGEVTSKTILAAVQPAFIFDNEEVKSSKKSLEKPALLKFTDVAYYIATSGSTGSPKIIKVPHSSLAAWIHNSRPTWDVTNLDRVSQVFDLAFDPAISDVLWAFLSGACLVPLDLLGMADTPNWIHENRVTIWSSSPSQGKSLILSLDFRSELIRTVRRSTFIGEILTKKFALEWNRLIPQSRIENHYGPAECVISVSREIIDFKNLEDDILSIGVPYPGVKFLMDESGGLIIQSEQMAYGYLNASSSAFTIRGYKSGDLVTQTSQGSWRVLGRSDSQVKINGQRWESEGIEACFEKYLQCPVCIHKWESSEFEGIDLVLFGKPASPLATAFEKVFSELLPAALRPRSVWYRAEAPLNLSGKLNRPLIRKEISQGLLNVYEA